MNIKLFLSTIPLLLFQFSLAVDLPLPEGFTLVDSSSSYKMVLTPYATYPVTLEQYSPKIIIQGKWGTNPGEFSFEYYEDNEGMTKSIYPSMAVNSKGEIYILDIMNNRIQKFDNEGKHLKNIVVPIRADRNEKSIVHLSTKPYYVENSFEFDNKAYYYEKSKAYYYGINIAIDAQDTLYYYTHKGANKGEVWEFKDDILSNKHELPSHAEMLIRAKENGEVYALCVSTDTQLENRALFYDFKKHTFANDRRTKVISKPPYAVHIVNPDMGILKVILPDSKETTITIPEKYRKRFFIFPDNCFLIENNYIRIYTEYSGTGDDLKYDLTGRLTGILLYPSLDSGKSLQKAYNEKFGTRFGHAMGNNGWKYLLFYTADIMKIILDDIRQ